MPLVERFWGPPEGYGGLPVRVVDEFTEDGEPLVETTFKQPVAGTQTFTLADGRPVEPGDVDTWVDAGYQVNMHQETVPWVEVTETEFLEAHGLPTKPGGVGR